MSAPPNLTLFSNQYDSRVVIYIRTYSVFKFGYWVVNSINTILDRSFPLPRYTFEAKLWRVFWWTYWTLTIELKLPRNYWSSIRMTFLASWLTKDRCWFSNLRKDKNRPIQRKFKCLPKINIKLEWMLFARTKIKRSKTLVESNFSQIKKTFERTSEMTRKKYFFCFFNRKNRSLKRFEWIKRKKPIKFKNLKFRDKIFFECNLKIKPKRKEI